MNRGFASGSRRGGFGSRSRSGGFESGSRGVGSGSRRVGSWSGRCMSRHIGLVSAVGVRHGWMICWISRGWGNRLRRGDRRQQIHLLGYRVRVRVREGSVM